MDGFETMTSRVPGEELTAIDSDALMALLEAEMHRALDALDGPAPNLSGMVDYHLGFMDTSFRTVDLSPSARGKRMRPAVAMLACAAVGGEPERAAPLAAAIEILHNFTLIHDDIQDHSPVRRHRPTVWKEWGIAQAINAGDAAFAASQIALVNLRRFGVDPDLILRLVDAFNRMTIRIVQGQALDLDFEGRDDVTPDDYLLMIELKTAVIVRFAAWAGALLGGAEDAHADRFAEFGRTLGIGFQVRDDLLGIWGATATTGKAAADDIRRRKQSLPILMLRDEASCEETAELEHLYRGPEVDQAGVVRVLELLERHRIRQAIEQRIAELHSQAALNLDAAARPGANPGRDALAALVSMLAGREN